MVLSKINPSSFVVQSNGILGAMEISTYFSLILYGVSLSQGYTYFRNRKEDRFSLKFLVFTILFLETCHSFTAPIAIYQNTVINWQDPKANSYPIATNIVFEDLITLLVQCYFVFRIYILSENLQISVVCFIFVSLRFIGGMVLVVETYLDVPNRPNGITLVVTFSWLVTSALALGGTADVLIAMCLTYYLRKLSSFGNVQATTNLVNRLIRWTLQTGLITSMASVSVIICFQAFKNMVWFGLYIILAKLYSNAFLVSLNARPLYKGPSSLTKQMTTLQFQVPVSISFPTNDLYNDPSSEWEKTRMEEV